MDLQKEKDAYLGELLERNAITQNEYNDIIFRPSVNAFDSNYLSARFIDNVNWGWNSWQARAQKVAVPEGYVLVEKSKIFHFWQDNDEPENFCSTESDVECLGDCIDLGEIMEINKFAQVTISKEKLFGTWFAEAIDPSKRANFFIGTNEECLAIVEKNKSMIEAQEQVV